MRWLVSALAASALLSCADGIDRRPVRCMWSADATCVECIKGITALRYYSCQVCTVGAEPTRCKSIDESKIVLR